MLIQERKKLDAIERDNLEKRKFNLDIEYEFLAKQKRNYLYKIASLETEYDAIYYKKEEQDKPRDHLTDSDSYKSIPYHAPVPVFNHKDELPNNINTFHQHEHIDERDHLLRRDYDQSLRREYDQPYKITPRGKNGYTADYREPSNITPIQHNRHNNYSNNYRKNINPTTTDTSLTKRVIINDIQEKGIIYYIIFTYHHHHHYLFLLIIIEAPLNIPLGDKKRRVVQHDDTKVTKKYRVATNLTRNVRELR